MDPVLIEKVVGYTSALLVSFLNLPQAIKVFRTCSAESLSSWSLGLHLLNSLLWLCYGLLIAKTPIVFANLCYLATNIALIVFKLHFNKERIQA
jgi:MtN3 and saliva related transmembrane protein